MERLNITLWPTDHMDLPFVTPIPDMVRHQEKGNKEIVQISLAIDSRMPKNISSEILKRINKWPLPRILERDDIPVFTREKIEIDPQFVLHVLPTIEIEDAQGVVNFIDLYGTLDLDEYPNMTKKIPTVIQRNLHDENIKHKDISIDGKKYGSLISMQEATAIAILRDLKAMSKHIIAESRNESVVEPWVEAGYSFKGTKFTQREAQWMLAFRLKQGLGMMRLTPIFDFIEGEKDDHANTKASAGLFQAACLQLYKFHSLNRPISKCEHIYCKRYFSTSTGYDVKRSSRTTGLKYCSQQCAKAAKQREYRIRKQQGGK